MRGIYIGLTTLLLALGACSGVGKTVEISNGSLTVGFERSTGRLVSFRGTRELIDSAAVEALPWKEETLQSQPYTVSFRKHGARRVDILWLYPSKEVRLEVSLEKDRPLSHWRLSPGVTGPVISGVKPYANADLLVPTWLGKLVHDPSEGDSFSQRFPGGSARMMALYDRQSLKDGLYLSLQDTVSTIKDITFSFGSGHVECSVSGADCDVVAGLFDGDWMDAAQLYRQWALKQKFCLGSRFHKGLTPKWLEETAFWVWNRGHSDNVLKEAMDFQQRVGLPVNAYWHWWHGCPYDEGFPEYLPPREGREHFIEAVRQARAQGVHSVVYMNSIQWGDSTPSFESKGAAEYAARSEDGSTYRTVYQVFSGNGLTPMCMATPFWRDTYAALCDTVVSRYGVGGVYMDQASVLYPCYSPSHGHPVGGGHSWVDSFGELTSQIRRAFPEGSDAILAGEGSGEDWLPLLDAFLTLPPSQERYEGVNNTEPVPLFQAIYHDYAITYGNYSSLVYPPYDGLWAAEFRPANTETLLPEEFNMQFRLEQARAFTWGLQPTLANYHSFLFDSRPREMEFLVDLVKTRSYALDYLLFGVLKGVPCLGGAQQTIPISRVSIYAGRTGDTVRRYEKTVGTLLAALWQSPDGNLALAVTNISDEPQRFSLPLDPGRYGLTKGRVNLVTSCGSAPFGTFEGPTTLTHTVPPRTSCLLELTD